MNRLIIFLTGAIFAVSATIDEYGLPIIKVPSPHALYKGTDESEYCPNKTAIAPCTCDAEGISCMYAKNGLDLVSSFAKDSPSYEHRGLFIQRSGVDFITEATFGQYVFQTVNIDFNRHLKNFTVASLYKSAPYLVQMSIYGNNLSDFGSPNWRLFRRLQVLNLGGNNIKTIQRSDTIGLDSLIWLSLSQNPIVSIEANAFASMVRLQNLQLRQTKLTTIGDYVFNIRTNDMLNLDLRNSSISNVEQNAFGSVTKFNVIFLHGNNLTTLPKYPFQDLVRRMALSRSAGLTMEGNPFNCQHCDNSWLPQYYNYASKMLFGFQCSDGRSLSSLSRRDFAHC